MPVDRDPDTARSPLVRFTLLVFPGFLAATLFAWSAATWGPQWVPNGEETVALIGGLVVFVAVLHARLNTWLHGAAAIATAVALHIMIYYARLLYLLDASYNRVLLRHLAEIAGAGTAVYALAVAAALVLTAIHKRKAKAE